MDSSSARWEQLTRRLSEASDAELAPSDITRTTSLSDDLDLGSLQMVSLVMDLEDDFRIEVDEEELEGLGDAVGGVFDLLEQKIAAAQVAESA